VHIAIIIHKFTKYSKQSKQFSVNLVSDEHEIFRPVFEIKPVRIYDEELSVVGGNPLFVVTVQAIQVVDTDGLLVCAAASAYLGDEMGDRSAEVYQQVGGIHHRHHQIVQLHIRVVIPPGEIALFEIVCHEDADAFHKRPVLDNHIFGFGDFEDVAEALGQKIGFKVLAPAGYVAVVVFKVRIVCDGLVFRGPAVMGGKKSGKCRLSAAYVACYSNVHFVSVLSYKFSIFAKNIKTK